MNKINTYKIVWCYSIYGCDFFKYYEALLDNISIACTLGIRVIVNTRKSDESVVRYYFKQCLNDIDIFVHDEDFAENYPKILRFLTIKKVNASYYFFKDSDSVVTQKELDLMAGWMSSHNPKALIIRDHPAHVSPIMAGMFGVSSDLANYIASSAQFFFSNKKGAESLKHDPYSYDQDWLSQLVYPVVSSQALVATSFFYYSNENYIRIKRELDNYQYIGAQLFKRKLGLKEIESISLFYGGQLLTLPYYPKLWRIYKNLRITLLIAFLFTRFTRRVNQ